MIEQSQLNLLFASRGTNLHTLTFYLYLRHGFQSEDFKANWVKISIHIVFVKTLMRQSLTSCQTSLRFTLLSNFWFFYFEIDNICKINICLFSVMLANMLSVLWNKFSVLHVKKLFRYWFKYRVNKVKKDKIFYRIDFSFNLQRYKSI